MMRRLIVIFGLTLAAAPLQAQAAKIELRAVLFGMPTKRNAALDPTTVGEASGTLKGGEIGLRAKTFGVAVRLLNGDLSASGGGSGGGPLTVGEARVQLGPRIVALEGGYVRRAIGGPLGTTVYSFVRAGAASVIDIGDSGFFARLSAGVYLAGQGVPGAKISGHEVVTALEYHPRHLPLLVMLGYRAEVFQVSGSGSDRPENVSGVILGAGLRLAR